MKIRVGKYELEKGDIRLLFYRIRQRIKFNGKHFNLDEIEYMKNDILTLERLWRIENEK